MLEDRGHEWIDNYEAVQPSSLKTTMKGKIEELTIRHRSKVKPLWLVEREAIQSAIELQVEAVSQGPLCC